MQRSGDDPRRQRPRRGGRSPAPRSGSPPGGRTAWWQRAAPGKLATGATAREVSVAVDDDVLEALRRDDRAEALRIALRAYGPGVLGYLETVLGDADDARDVFQAASEDLWDWLPSYRGGSLRAAAYRIGRHAAARFRREAWRRRRERMRTTMASRIAASMTSPESRLAPKPKDRLERLREALDADERTLLILRLDRELSWKEVAEVLSEEGDPVDSAAVRKRFERVKERLAKLAKEEGLL
jgi:RNA polymerase sigma-70 factor (ECF subfamily)